MSVELHDESDGNLLVVKLNGKLSKLDYERFIPEVEKAINEHGKIRVLVEMRDFHGWTAGALWEDVKFDLKHFAHIERLALVGERKWEAGMAVFCKPFTSAKVRYFDRHQLDEAFVWVAEGIRQPTA
ncbi:MAG TPA: STAS/SEC14 domain-containing protein [Pirellulales bacterium]|nr:STAS/SEC14 domain-containing protein [Pirellulales bacterium]